MDILNYEIGKIASRKPRITEPVINKMKERRKVRTTNIEEYRTLNNQLRRESDRAKEVYMEEICDLEERKINPNASESTEIRRKNYQKYKNIWN